MTTSAVPGELFAPTVAPRVNAPPRVPSVPSVPPRPRGTDPGGRHSVDGDHWDEEGTEPLRISALGVRPQARGGQHRRPEPRSRIASLDGLRGVAALVVVVYHVFLTQPALAEPYRDPAADVDAATWWATFTPLHLGWAGPEAVFVFFVLSGLVLALPVADSGRINPFDYYPRRLVRLYLPVWAAVGLTVAWAAGFPRVWPDGTSWWIVGNATQPTVDKVLADLLLVWSPGQANHVLWSLQWEVVYCLVLPLVLLVLRWSSPLWAFTLGLVTAALVLGATIGNLALSSLPLFVLGTLMAVEHRRMSAWAGALDRSRLAGLWWGAAAVLSVVLLLSYWLLHALPVPATAVGPAEHVARALQGLGAGLIVAVVWLCPWAQRPMTRPWVQWLGSRSFSLYLVHLPVVATVTLLFDGRPHLLVALAGSLLVALPLAEVFYRLAERPSHRVARRVGRAMAARARSAPAPEVVPAIAETGPIRLIPAPGPAPAGDRRRVPPPVPARGDRPGSGELFGAEYLTGASVMPGPVPRPARPLRDATPRADRQAPSGPPPRPVPASMPAPAPAQRSGPQTPPPGSLFLPAGPRVPEPGAARPVGR